ncbi:MAG: energy transducer TonB [Nitrospira sp.]
MTCGNGLVPIRLTLRSWGCSLFLHVVWWGVAGWIWSQESVQPRHDAFRWDGVLVQHLSTKTAMPVLAQAQQVSKSEPVSIAGSATAAHENTAAVSRASAEPVEVAPVIEAYPSTVTSDRAIVSEPMPSVAEDVLSQDINDRSSPMAETAVAVSSVNPVPVTPLDEAPVQRAEEASRETEASTLVSRGGPQESREDASAPAPAPMTATAVSSDAINDSQPLPAALRGEPVAAVTTGPASIQAKPDFGWLMQTLWSRVAELKRYPHEARLNHWQGKVVVRAVIDEHGHLLEVTIATSSGHEALDRAAIEVIKRSCPLALPQPLGRSQIVLRVPIQYRLDS